jgi:hypothetical protein
MKGEIIPLQIVRPGVFVLLISAKRAHVSWRIVHQSVPDHFVFSFEAFAAYATRAIRDRAVMRPLL